MCEQSWQRGGFDVVYGKNKFKKVWSCLFVSRRLPPALTMVPGRPTVARTTVYHFLTASSSTTILYTSRWVSRTRTLTCSDTSTGLRRRRPFTCNGEEGGWAYRSSISCEVTWRERRCVVASLGTKFLCWLSLGVARRKKRRRSLFWWLDSILARLSRPLLWKVSLTSSFPPVRRQSNCAGLMSSRSCRWSTLMASSSGTSGEQASLKLGADCSRCDRCNLSGVDLNRQWGCPNKRLHPSVYHIKKLLLRTVAMATEVDYFVDIHGHSKKLNAFLYACRTSSLLRGSCESIGGDDDGDNACRVLPWLLSKINRNYDFSSSTFGLEKGKVIRRAGRVVDA